MTSFIILILLLIFTFTLLGLDMFAHTARFTYSNKLTSYFSYNWLEISDIRSTHDSNFDTFFDAFLTVFLVITGDGWADIYQDHYRASGGLKTNLFFLPLIVVGTYILLNLFLTIMLQEFDENTLSLIEKRN